MSAISLWKEGLRPELELVLCCAHTRLDERNADRIRELLRGQLGWSGVTATASEHHLEPFVYENLKLARNGLVPEAWLNNMRERASKTAGLAVVLSSELLRVCEVFEVERVPLVPYKGPILGWLAYQSLTRRRFLDLDFFVPQKHMPRAAALLKCAGFDGKCERLQELTGRFGYVPGQYAFSREAPRTQIELHTEGTLRHFPVPLDFEKMGRRLITVELCGQKIRTFSIEDTLVMLCVHGAKHHWQRILWLLDVAELIRVHPIDWPLTIRIAAKLRCARLLLLGLYLANELLNAPLPEPVLKLMRQNSNLRWLAAKVREELADGVGPRMGIVPRAAFRFRSRDGVGDAVWQTLRLATMPKEGDRKNISLPKALAPLYGLAHLWKSLKHDSIWSSGSRS